MKKSCLALGVAALVLGCVESNAAAEGAPQIHFDNPIFDFGRVKGGELVKHSFVFTNTGGAMLEILQVKPGCGCTTAGTWDTKVEPGKTGSIPLQFNSAGFGGRVAKSATITCNDPKQSNIVLQLSGTVWKPIDLSQSVAVFNFPPEGQTNQSTAIRITSNLDEPVTLSEPVNTNKAIRTELVTIRPGKEFELKVTAIAPFATTMVAPIKINTSSKEMPEISTSAYVTVLSAVSVLPQQIMLPAGPLAADSHPSVSIRANTTNSLALSDAEINVPGGQVTFKEVQPGKFFNLSLSLPTGFQVAPGQKVEVTVKSNHPRNPVIHIPVVQLPNTANQPLPNTAKLSTPTSPAVAH